MIYSILLTCENTTNYADDTTPCSIENNVEI